jgi:hypothetical protein
MSIMPFQQEPEVVTQRERELHRQEIEMFEMQSAHTLKMKQLELQIVEKETRWSNAQKIPLTIVKLPVLFVFAIAFLFKKDLPDEFWSLFGITPSEKRKASPLKDASST